MTELAENVENVQQAKERKLAERASLEVELSEIGGRVNALASRKTELDRAITLGNRQRQDVGEYRAELATVETDLDDARAQIAGVRLDLELIYTNPVDGLQALLELHRPELTDLARQASADAEGRLHELIEAFGRFKQAHAVASRVWREAFAVGPGHLGHRAELGNARWPGGSAWDAVEIRVAPVYGGARDRTPGRTFVDPVALLGEVIEQMAGRDCLPACAVTDPRHGEPGVYRGAFDAQRIKLDERALRHRRAEVDGEDGFSALRFARELTAADRETLKNNRADDARWRAGGENPHPIGDSLALLPEPDGALAAEVMPTGDSPRSERSWPCAG